METDSYGIMQAAVSAAERTYDGDDFDLLWSFERDEAGTSHGKVKGVEGVEGGFWVDARVWVNDADIEQDIAKHVKDNMSAEANAGLEPAIYLGPQEIKDHFDGADSALESVVMDATYEQLLAVGKDAVMDERFWTAFHDVLVDVIREKMPDEVKLHEALKQINERGTKEARSDKISGSVAELFRNSMADQPYPMSHGTGGNVEQVYPGSPLASRRVTALPIKYGSKVRHVSGSPEGTVIIVVGDGMYTVKWDSGVEERIHESEIVVLEQPPRPTLPLFDSKLEGAIKDLARLARAVDDLAQIIDGLVAVVGRDETTDEISESLETVRDNIRGLR